MEMPVLNVARPTPGDSNFYKRWEKIGPVFMEIPQDPSLWKTIQVLVVDQHFEVNPGALELTPNVKFVCSATTGHTHLKFEPHEYGIHLVTLRGETQFLSSIRSVSEFTFNLILTMLRPMDACGHTLNDKHLGIVGLGRIGKHIQQIAKGFGMTIRTFDLGDQYSVLETLFRESDIITICLSENDSTHKMIDSKLINQMKPSSYFINVSRGSIVDEVALFNAASSGYLAGVALDVQDGSLPWESVPNVIITPHIAGSTIEDRIRTDEFIVNKLSRLILH